MANITDICYSCHQSFYQQSLYPLEYVDFTFAGQQISLIGCFIESSHQTASASFGSGPRICLTCVDLLRSCHYTTKPSNDNLPKLSYTCGICLQHSSASNMLNLRLTVVNGNGRQISLEECLMVCRKVDKPIRETTKICLACVSSIVEDYIKLPEFMVFNHADVKIEPVAHDYPEEGMDLNLLKVEPDLDICEVEVPKAEHSVANAKAASTADPLTGAVRFKCHKCGVLFLNAQDILHHHYEAHNEPSANTLKCSECPLKFESHKQTVQHKQKDHSKRQFECHFCGLRYTAKRYLSKHMNTHRSEPAPPKPASSKVRAFVGSFRERVQQSKLTIASLENDKKPEVGEFICDWPGCGKVCRNSHSLSIHAFSHEGFKIGQICRLCDMKFKCRTSYKEHLASHTMSNGLLRCNHCPETFVTYKEAQRHCHPNDVPYECHHCKYTSPYLSYVRNHLWKSHFRRNFECGICGEVLESLRLYRHHRYMHGKKHQQCAGCLKKFTLKQSYDRHISRWKHLFDCPKCEVKVHTLGQLETHMETKHNEVFPCHICNQPFRSTLTMEKHLKRLHGIIPDAKCRKCGATFATPAELTAHLRVEHQKISKTNYVCEQCGKGFTSKNVLGKHTARHQFEQQFACKLCNRVFKKSQSLENHIQIIHLRSRKRKSTNMVYTCPECPQWKFGRHQALEGHMIVHNTENRPYFQCDKCGVAYTRRQKFDEHIKRCSK